MEEMNEEVLPLPLVPAIWMGFSWSKSAGWQVSVGGRRLRQHDSHLISCLLDPFDHLRDGILVHALSRFPNRIDDGEVTLQCVERGDRGIVVTSHAAIPSDVFV
jgi:hypothetical protein